MEVLRSLPTAPPPAPYSLPLHDALPISGCLPRTIGRRRNEQMRQQHPSYIGQAGIGDQWIAAEQASQGEPQIDRKSTRLNSSHSQISYAVFCLKKKMPRAQ